MLNSRDSTSSRSNSLDGHENVKLVDGIANDIACTPVKLAYQMEEYISHGVFGNVYKITLLKPEQLQLAIKRVVQKTTHINRELDMLRELQRHPNIIQLHYYYYEDGAGVGKSKDHQILFLLMEYMPKNLSEIIYVYRQTSSQMHIGLVKVFSWQLCRAVAYLNGLGIAHRDIKPSNVLIDPSKGSLKVCDLGSAKRLKPTEKNVSYVCSRFYRAPELILGKEFYGVEVDAWSIGCVAAEMLLNGPLFKGENKQRMLQIITSIIGFPTEEDITEMDAKERIDKVMRKPSMPITTSLEARLQSGKRGPVDQGMVQFIRGFLVYSPRKRSTAASGLQTECFAQIRAGTQGLPNGRKPPDNLLHWTTTEISLGIHT